ncbi:hypothetical protein NDU88_008982 [Pleurodeles waltl]|uniref:Uncharacterized protein n=1 Tax=Pleurodeles waltl TaxID=8319 RepID=A0AAV7NXM2_PLEWA|nr:hypothetical protein NDU88_008982 [Pleurodeles waltl]
MLDYNFLLFSLFSQLLKFHIEHSMESNHFPHKSISQVQDNKTNCTYLMDDELTDSRADCITWTTSIEKQLAVWRNYFGDECSNYLNMIAIDKKLFIPLTWDEAMADIHLEPRALMHKHGNRLAGPLNGVTSWYTINLHNEKRKGAKVASSVFWTRKELEQCMAELIRLKEHSKSWFGKQSKL